MLVDFGLAKIIRGSQATTTGARGLTPGYSPPEQYGSARTDHRSDIYALAATLYAALTGTPPEDGLARAMAQSSLTRVRDHNPKINDSVAIAIERALEVQPDDRFQTAGEFKDALLATGESATIIQGAPAGGMIVTPPPTEFVDQADRLVEEMEDSFRSGVQSTISDTVSTPEPKTRRGWLSCVLALGAVGIIGVVGFGLAYLLAPDFLSTFIGTQSTDVVATDVVAQVPSQTVTLAPPTATLVPLPTNTEMAVIPADTLAPTDTPYPTETPTLAATPMGGGGQIAFASDRVGGLPQIWMVNLDGSNPTQVTDIRDGACQPDWSPEGTRLVFISPCAGNKVTYNGSALFLVNADGSGLVPLPSAPGGDFDPDWSPDGEKIAFTSVRDNNRPQIWVFDLASNQASTLSNSKSSDFQPDWSPDGTKIVFVTTRTGATQLWYMDASGRPWDEFSRSNDFVNTHPIWSPTGDFIMFIQNTQSGRIPWFQVAYWEDGGPQRGFREFTVNEDYLAPRRDPGYSPDGFWIVFESNPEGPNHDIFIMTANGTGVQQVTTDPANDFDPAWRPMRPHP
jgi:hypothetical protein